MTLPDVIGVVGSRAPDSSRGRETGWREDQYPVVLQIATRAQLDRHRAQKPCTIVSGGAPSGVDRQIRIACKALGFCDGAHLRRDPTTVDCPRDHFHEIRAKWRRADGSTNKAAGFERNDKLVRHVGLLIALFADGDMTPGTMDAVRRARSYNVPVLIYHEGKWRG